MCKNEWFRCAFLFLVCLVLTGAIILSFFFGLYESVVVSVIGRAFDMVVILDAGHGGEDCGAVGINGVFEKDLNLSIAFCVRDLLVAAGVNVEMTRTEDRLLYTKEQNIKGQRKINDLKNRLLFAQTYEDAIFVSLHMNKFSQPTSFGAQVWYSDHDEAQELAKKIQTNITQVLQPNNRRKIKPCDSSMYLLYRSMHPAVLVECGFLSNDAECAQLCQSDYQKQLSFVLFCAIMELVSSID